MGTTWIKIKCEDQTLKATRSPSIASGGIEADAIEFEFDELWTGFAKTAVFYRSERSVYHVAVVDDKCIVPSEILRMSGYFYIGVMGVKDGVTRTSNVLSYRVEPGAITEGVKPPEPTPSIYESILASVKSAEQIAKSVRDDADAGKFDGAPGPKGDPGSDASVTAENIQSALGFTPIKDVQVGGNSVLVDGVAKVPVASETKEGVIRTPYADGSFGIKFNNSNQPYVVAASEADITARQTFYRPIVPPRIDYTVKAAMCDGKGAAWTSDEQKAARERMGIDKPYELIENIMLTEDAAVIIRTTEPDGTLYKLKSVVIFVETSASVASSWVDNYINSDNGDNIYYGFTTTSKDNYSMAFMFEVYGGFLRGFGQSGSNLISLRNSTFGMAKNPVANYITNLRFVSYKANTVIRIYGVRA